MCNINSHESTLTSLGKSVVTPEVEVGGWKLKGGAGGRWEHKASNCSQQGCCAHPALLEEEKGLSRVDGICIAQG